MSCVEVSYKGVRRFLQTFMFLASDSHDTHTQPRKLNFSAVECVLVLLTQLAHVVRGVSDGVYECVYMCVPEYVVCVYMCMCVFVCTLSVMLIAFAEA